MIARILLTICALVLMSAASQAAPKNAKWGAKYFPNQIVTSHEGKTFRFYDDLIKDKIVVINFVYTNCPDICGLQSARMAIVQDLLGDRLGRDIFIYSISLDPERDTPEILKEYAAAIGAKPGWLFLTGDTEGLHKIRYKLGERSRSLAEHRNDAVLGNDKTGEWGRSSIMANLKLLAQDIMEMDPATREIRRKTQSATTSGGSIYRKLGKHSGQALFLKACAACHTIGMGDHIGPDLENLSKRRKVAWLTEYLMAPDVLRKRGDSTAISVGKRFKGISMPNLGLSKRDAADLISYVEAQTNRLAGKQTKSDHGAHKAHAHKH
ncbi:MAG: protein SCO1/2 [Hyphomicrobiaceae bacterium]|jgi:protein SCO1/2